MENSSYGNLNIIVYGKEALSDVKSFSRVVDCNNLSYSYFVTKDNKKTGRFSYLTGKLMRLGIK